MPRPGAGAYACPMDRAQVPWWSRRSSARDAVYAVLMTVITVGGLSNDEIAARLYLSPLTAKTHVSRIMTKLSARYRAQLVVLGYETGLVTPGQAQLP